MNKVRNGYLFSGRQSKTVRPSLTKKELELLRLAKRVGTSLEATAKVILLLRARRNAADLQADHG